MPPITGGRATPLSDYISAFMERAEMNVSQFLRECVDPDDPTRVIYPQWFGTMLAGRGPMPELWRLRALAAALRVDVNVVKKLAITQWLDYEVEEVRVDDEVIVVPLKRPVSEAQRRKIRQMIELMAENEE